MKTFNISLQRGSETTGQDQPTTPTELGGVAAGFPEVLKANSPEIVELLVRDDHLIDQALFELEKSEARNVPA